MIFRWPASCRSSTCSALKPAFASRRGGLLHCPALCPERGAHLSRSGARIALRAGIAHHSMAVARPGHRSPAEGSDTASDARMDFRHRGTESPGAQRQTRAPSDDSGAGGKRRSTASIQILQASSNDMSRCLRMSPQLSKSVRASGVIRGVGTMEPCEASSMVLPHHLSSKWGTRPAVRTLWPTIAVIANPCQD